MADKRSLLRDIKTSTRQTLAMLETLRPADWDVASPIEGWRVRDVVVHLLEVDDKILHALGRITAAIAGCREPAGSSAADPVTRYRVSGERIQTVLESFPLDQLARPVEIRGLGRVSAEIAFRLRPFEQFNHTNDIARALARPLEYLPVLVRPALRFVRRAAPWLIAYQRIADKRLSFGFQFDGPAPDRWRFMVADGEARVEPWRGEEVDTAIHGDPAVFLICSVLGKKSPGKALLARKVRVSGDREACTQLRCFFPLLVPSDG